MSRPDVDRTAERDGSPLQSGRHLVDDLIPDRVHDADTVTLTVVGIVAVGLLARLILLGDRIAHFDEGRVGYWIMHFVETGEFHYRYIIHGPFVQHVNAALFPVTGANDFTLRLVVALIGGLFPLAVLFLREHLDDAEVVAVALFLVANPAMLYYSRFFRSTIPAAAFAFVAFALLVRFSDTRRVRYLHGAVVFVALAFTAKENAAIYLLVWLGAAALLVDHSLFRPGGDETGLDRLSRWWSRNVGDREWRRALPRLAGHAVLAAALFFVVILYFYAPRAGNTDGIGLWSALASGEVVPLLEETWRSIQVGYGYWFGGGLESGDAYNTIGERFAAYFGDFFNTLVAAAGPLFAFAILGTAVERYASRRRRYLVMFAAYWGFVSVVGYPLGADIIGAKWTVVNVVIPLSIPAAVGVVTIYRWGVEARDEDDRIGVVLVGFVLALVVFQVAATGATSVYLSPQSPDNALVQYAQPADDLRPTLQDMRALAAENEGTDVLFYGEALTSENVGRMEPGCTKMARVLPLQWYLAITDAEADCAADLATLDSTLSDGPPPIVVTTPSNDVAVSDRLDDYERREYQLRAPGEEVSIYVDTDRLDGGG